MNVAQYVGGTKIGVRQKRKTESYTKINTKKDQRAQ
jgi:hypothetical protein